MKNTLLIIFGLVLLMSCQTENSKKNNKSSKNPVKLLAKEAAKTAINKGEIKLLKAKVQEQPKYELPQVLDSLMYLLDGLQYSSEIPEGIDSIKSYREAFNQEMKVHLNKKFGPNWSQCLALKNIMEHQRQLFRLFSTDELVSQYIVLAGNIFFDPTTNQIDSNGIKLIEMNIQGLRETDKLQAQTLNVIIQAYYGANSSKEEALNRSIALQTALEQRGLPTSRIRILEHQPAILPDCSQCPFDIQTYANRVELSFDN